jgi:hypothetical protein
VRERESERVRERERERAKDATAAALCRGAAECATRGAELFGFGSVACAPDLFLGVPEWGGRARGASLWP